MLVEGRFYLTLAKINEIMKNRWAVHRQPSRRFAFRETPPPKIKNRLLHVILQNIPSKNENAWLHKTACFKLTIFSICTDWRWHFVKCPLKF